MRRFLKGCAILFAVLIALVILLGVVGSLCGPSSDSDPSRATPTTSPVNPTSETPTRASPTPTATRVLSTSTPTKVTPTATRVLPTSTPTKVPPTSPPHFDASDLFDEYRKNETRANSLYTGKTLTVTLNGINRIGASGRVLKRMDEWGFSLIQLDFEVDSQVVHLNPGDSVTAICKVGGLSSEYSFSLSLEECRLVRTR